MTRVGSAGTSTPRHRRRAASTHQARPPRDAHLGANHWRRARSPAAANKRATPTHPPALTARQATALSRHVPPRVLAAAAGGTPSLTWWRPSPRGRRQRAAEGHRSRVPPPPPPTGPATDTRGQAHPTPAHGSAPAAPQRRGGAARAGWGRRGGRREGTAAGWGSPTPRPRWPRERDRHKRGEAATVGPATATAYRVHCPGRCLAAGRPGWLMDAAGGGSRPLCLPAVGGGAQH